ncbi:hypothetical protein IWW47_002470 [Coemansia sp. RSA 2052]|nr:hypothetical protein IWW47_002470 [Coemansia sp. RSA 2052]
MSIFDTWTTVAVQGSGTSSRPEMVFRLQCAGGYCAVCEKCQHRSLVSPNIHHALLCPHCQEPLVLPLGAHFVCPARLEPQFAIQQPFDIERFLAYRVHEQANDSAQSSGEFLRWDGSSKRDNTEVSCVFIGFMDLVDNNGCAHKLTRCGSCRVPSGAPQQAQAKRGGDDGFQRLLDQTVAPSPRQRGFWSALVKRCSGIGSRSERGMRQRVHRHVLAVVDSRHITWYDVAGGGGKTDDQIRRVEQIALLGAQFSADSSSAGMRVAVAARSGRRVEMDLGSRIVASMWLHVLARRGAIKGGRGSPAYNGEMQRWTMADGANVHAFNNIADGYSSSGLAGDDDISEFQFDVGSDIIEPATVAHLWLEGSRSGSGSQAAIRLVPI